MTQIKSKITKFIVTFLTVFACVLLLIQAPAINTILLQGMINFALPKGYSVQLSKTQGSFPFDVHIPLITVSDKEGQWATIESFEYAWRGIDVLFGNVHFDFIQADKINLLRLPHGSESEKKQAVLHNNWPHLNIDHLEVKHVILDPAIVPCGDVFSIQAQVESEYFGQHAITLFVEKRDRDVKDKVLLTLVCKCSKDQFSATATYIDNISSVKKYCPLMETKFTRGHVSLRLKFLTDYNFEKPYLSFKGIATDLDSPDTYLSDFLNRNIEWKIKVRKHQMGESEKGFDIEHIFARTGRNMTLNGVASFDPESGKVAGSLRLNSPQIQQFWGMSEEILAGDPVVNITVDGDVYKKKTTLKAEAFGLKLYKNPLEKLTLKIQGELSSLNELSGDVTLSLHQGAFETYVVSQLGQKEPFIWTLDPVEVVAPNTKAKGSVTLDGTTGEITANINGTVSDMAPYGELIGKQISGKLTFETTYDRNHNFLMSADLEQWQFDMLAGDKLSLQGQITEFTQNLTAKGSGVVIDEIPFSSLTGQYSKNKGLGSFSVEGLGLNQKKN